MTRPEDQTRRCRHCQAPVRVVERTRHFINGAAAGFSYEWRCDGCARSFATRSPGQLLLLLFLTPVCLGGGLLMAGAALDMVLFGYHRADAGFWVLFGLGVLICLPGLLGGYGLGRTWFELSKNPVITSTGAFDRTLEDSNL